SSPSPRATRGRAARRSSISRSATPSRPFSPARSSRPCSTRETTTRRRDPHMTLSDFPSTRPTLADLTEKLGDDFVAEDDGRVYHCPAHDDSKPSLRVSVSAESGRVLLKCRAGCSNTKVMEAVGMTISDLATMAAGEVDFAPATSVDRPADPAAVAALAVKLDRWEEQLVAARQTAQPGEPVPVLDYAERRFGIGPDDASRLGLGLATDLGGGPRLVVPFRDQQGVARGFQARALADDAAVRWLGPKSPDGAQWAKLAWFPGSSGWDEVLITEGPGDSLTAVALGYDTIGIRGASLVNNPNVVDQVAEWVGDRVAVIAGDGDQSGRSFSATLARGLLARGARAKVLPVPDGLDLTDWRARDGDRFATEVVRAILEAEEETSLTAALQQRDPARYPRTDLGNAMFVRDFIAAKGSGVRYSPETGFYLLDGGVWRLDKLDRTRAYVQEAAVLVASIARQLQDNIVTEEDKKQAQAW